MSKRIGFGHGKYRTGRGVYDGQIGKSHLYIFYLSLRKRNNASNKCFRLNKIMIKFVLTTIGKIEDGKFSFSLIRYYLDYQVHVYDKLLYN